MALETIKERLNQCITSRERILNLTNNLKNSIEWEDRVALIDANIVLESYIKDTMEFLEKHDGAN